MKQNAQLMVMIYVDSVEEARSFYVDNLGFTHMMGMLGKDGLLDYCTITLGGARLMLMRPAGDLPGGGVTTGKRPVELYVEVADVDAYCEQVKTPRFQIRTQASGSHRTIERSEHQPDVLRVRLRPFSGASPNPLKQPGGQLLHAAALGSLVVHMRFGSDGP